MLDSRKQLNTVQVVQHWDRMSEEGISTLGGVQALARCSHSQPDLALATAMLWVTPDVSQH